jgi:hypothetical protein
MFVSALASLAIPGWALCAETDFSLTVGAEYTSGDYGGDQSVDDVYLPVTATFDLRRVSFRVTVPFLSVTAPEGTIIEEPGGQPAVGTGPRVTESGIGDVLAAMTVYDVLVSGSGNLALDLTGKVKFGTADFDQGLGTGEQDYSLQADLFRFFDRFTAIGTAGYTVRGDPDDVDLDDQFFASLGGTYAISGSTRCGLFFDYRESSLPGSDDMQELSVFLSRRFGDDWRMQGYAIAGFSDSSPDWGAGMSVTRRF